MTYAEALQIEAEEQEADRGRMRVAGVALVVSVLAALGGLLWVVS